MVERIVLNTSVLISGIIGTGSSLEVLKLILQKKVELLISSEIFEEYLIAVNYPEIAKKVDLYYVHPLLDVLYSLSTIIVPQINLNICRDPKDNKFFDAAIEGSAENYHMGF
jgi:putative PIN family toxin of toxin-antitoxin system